MVVHAGGSLLQWEHIQLHQIWLRFFVVEPNENTQSRWSDYKNQNKASDIHWINFICADLCICSSFTSFWPLNEHLCLFAACFIKWLPQLPLPLPLWILSSPFCALWACAPSLSTTDEALWPEPEGDGCCIHPFFAPCSLSVFRWVHSNWTSERQHQFLQPHESRPFPKKQINRKTPSAVFFIK